ncbi:MAG: acyltransferase [Erythrobacter sp.]|uniref:acyltransferase family protein n=1 Tax=Erythrobacter sp. TaxID=1042 RepID=UPI00260153EE|nr:acyltransferase [Erythrobacter sp.]MCL9998906.1 acyltransferase [Erythrobacter sp.]
MAVESAKTTPLHLPALDGLRGFAALVVLVSHCANAGFLPAALGGGLGKMGVTLFFGLSGFLMAYLYCREEFTPRAVWSYMVNRLARVLPLYYAVVIVTVISFYAFGIVLLDAGNVQAMVFNAGLIRGSSVLWTIPVEVHFYIVFMLLWMAFQSVRFVPAVLCLAGAQIALVAVMFSLGFEIGLLLAGWLHIFIFGAVLGANYQLLKGYSSRPAAQRFLTGLAWASLALLIIAPPEVRQGLGLPTLPPFIDPLSVGIPLLMLIFTVFLIGPFSFFKTGLLRWYGKISYSLYLLHIIVLDCVEYYVAGDATLSYAGFPATLLLATIVAWLSFTYLERPAHQLLRRSLVFPAGKRQKV